MSGRDLEQAEEALRRGKYDDAVERFRTLLSLDPEQAELRGRMAEAYRLTGNAERAFDHFRKAATFYIRQKDLLGAARMFEAANGVSPNEPDVLFRLAEVLKSLGKPQALHTVLSNLVKAASAPGDRRRLWALEHLAQLSPKDVHVQTQRAHGLLEQGRVADSLHIWTQVVDHLAATGVDFSAQLKAAADVAPDNLQVGVHLSNLLLKYKHYRPALGLIVPYYERFPDDVEIIEALVTALSGLNAKAKLLAAQLELLKARTRAGQRTQALDELRALLAQAPNDPRVLEVSAQACATFGLTGEACLRWFELATLYDEHEMGAKRDRIVLRILETQPDHEPALALGARVLREAGKDHEAEALELRLAEIQSRTSDELPAQSSPTTAAPRVSSQGAPPKDRTMVLSDVDVVAESVIRLPQVEEELDALARDDALSSDSAAAADAFSDDGITGEVTVYAAPAEAPQSPEEATSRMDEVVDSDLHALRRELRDDAPTSAGRVPQRALPRMVSDLLDELSAAEKP